MDANYEQESIHSFFGHGWNDACTSTKQIVRQDRAKVRIQGLDGTYKLIESTVGRFI